MGSCSSEAHHKHRLDLACLPCAVLVFDQKGNLVASNGRAADLHSGTREAPKGHSSRAAQTDDSHLTQARACPLQGSASRDAHWRILQTMWRCWGSRCRQRSCGTCCSRQSTSSEHCCWVHEPVQAVLSKLFAWLQCSDYLQQSACSTLSLQACALCSTSLHSAVFLQCCCCATCTPLPRMAHY